MNRFLKTINVKTKIIMVMSLAVIVGLSYSLAEITIKNRDEILKNKFNDVQFVSMMNTLIESGVIDYDHHNHQAIVNDARLKAMKLKPGVIARVHENLQYVKLCDETRLCYDAKRSSINHAYLQLASHGIYQRGVMMDRNGIIIAETNVNQRLRTKRNYPLGEALFHPVGVYSTIYNAQGLEASLDEILREGLDGNTLVTQTGDPTRKILSGNHVMLTLDATLQQQAFEIQKRYQYASGIIVLDARTAEVLVMSSFPSFDPNTAVGEKAWTDLMDNTIRAAENRTLKLLPPGSVFKIITLASYLENGGDMSQEFQCNGTEKDFNHPVRCIRSHGLVTGATAFIRSCNQRHGAMAMRLKRKLNNTGERFGFNSPIVLAQINGQLISAPASIIYPSNFDYDHNRGMLAHAGIGQNTVEVNALQMASVVQAIANRGIKASPSLIKEITDAKGNRLWRYKAKSRRVINVEYADIIGKLMGRVMTEGTGKQVKKIYRLPSGHYGTTAEAGSQLIHVMGKTGTAEAGFQNEDTHSWFVGAVPLNQPRYVIAVVAEYGGFGSQTAAPMAVEILAQALNRSNTMNK